MRKGHAAARPPVVIDAQVHAYAANTPERPWHSVPNWPAHVTGDEMVAAMASGRWKSGSAMAPRAVLDRVMWSSLTTSRARTTRHARWEFRGSVPLWRWAPNAGSATHPRMRTSHRTSATVLLWPRRKGPVSARLARYRASWRWSP